MEDYGTSAPWQQGQGQQHGSSRPPPAAEMEGEHDSPLFRSDEFRLW